MKRSFLIKFLAPFVVAGSLSAAHIDYLLDIDGIKGESQDDTYPGAIEVTSFTWGAANTGAAAGGGSAGKVSFHDLQFSTSSLGKASPKLFLACATGQHIAEAVLHVRKADPSGRMHEYLTIKMKPVYITSYQTGGSGNDTVSISNATEAVALYCDTITIIHTADDGTTTTGEAVRTPVTPQ
jgi:type VI secretion system secreted protein Hcp